MQRRVTSGVSRISARGVLMVRLDTKSEGGRGVLYASAHSLLSFAAKIRYKSIILAPMAEGGAQAPGAPSLDTPLGDHECREGWP